MAPTTETVKDVPRYMQGHDAINHHAHTMSIPESHPGTGKHVAAVTETVKEIPRYMQVRLSPPPTRAHLRL